MIEVMNTATTLGVVVLAAGASSRLGRPKQLLPMGGQSLLQHSIAAALASGIGPVVVVLGAHADTIAKELSGLPVSLVRNTNWQEGMAASIRCGITHLCAIHSTVTGMVLMVCDQPYVNAMLLRRLVAKWQQGGPLIVASAYADTYGPPTLFDRHLFPDLLQLTGDVGAKGILRRHAADLVAVPFPEGRLDVDTESDYSKISESSGS